MLFPVINGTFNIKSWILLYIYCKQLLVIINKNVVQHKRFCK